MRHTQLCNTLGLEVEVLVVTKCHSLEGIRELCHIRLVLIHSSHLSLASAVGANYPVNGGDVNLIRQSELANPGTA